MMDYLQYWRLLIVTITVVSNVPCYVYVVCINLHIKLFTPGKLKTEVVDVANLNFLKMQIKLVIYCVELISFTMLTNNGDSAEASWVE